MEFLGRNCASREQAIQQASVIDLDGEFAQLQLGEDLMHDAQALAVRDHRGVVTGNVKVLS